MSMESRKDKINLLCQVFVGLLVMSNILSAKLLELGPFLVPGGILCYAMTFLMLDVIGERYGEEQAKRTVLCGLFVQIICAILVQDLHNMAAKYISLNPADYCEWAVEIDRAIREL